MREGEDFVVNLHVFNIRVILEVLHLLARGAKGGEIVPGTDFLQFSILREALGLVGAVLVLVLDDEVDFVIVTGGRRWGT